VSSEKSGAGALSCAGGRYSVLSNPEKCARVKKKRKKE
jgi:hypothetical protein